jgi:dipeptidase D
MSKIIDHFKTITQIPHCSKEAGELFAFLVEFARQNGYHVQTDAAHNILASKGNPDLCLQAHYDMVCMGKAPTIEVYEEAGRLHARDASLGADNGIAIAMMMVLMEEGAELEFLLTSDEEIGLVGASALALDVRASRMLNLDSEDEGDVTIGCAGGADIVGTFAGARVAGEGTTYEVAVLGLPGGHSGVDIDRGIPNAIKVLFDYLHEKGIGQIASVIAGQRRNAIPSDAVAIVRSIQPLEGNDTVRVRRLNETPEVYANGDALVEWVHRFADGVRAHNDELGLPQTSINLALINDRFEASGLTIETSARAMGMDDLDALVQTTRTQMEVYGMTVRVEESYPAWQPERNPFVETVAEAVRAEFGDARIAAIHAGLECGILKAHLPDTAFASIGPTIRYPHSTRECVDLASVERTFRVVREIVKKLA